MIREIRAVIISFYATEECVDLLAETSASFMYSLNIVYFE